MARGRGRVREEAPTFASSILEGMCSRAIEYMHEHACSMVIRVGTRGRVRVYRVIECMHEHACSMVIRVGTRGRVRVYRVVRVHAPARLLDRY